MTNIAKINQLDETMNIVVLTPAIAELSFLNLSKNETDYIQSKIENKFTSLTLNQYNRFIFIEIIEKKENNYQYKEKIRIAAHKLCSKINTEKIKTITITSSSNNHAEILTFTESIILSNYQFTKYISPKENKNNSLNKIQIYCETITENEIFRIKTLTEGVYIARNLVNEPFSTLDTEQLCQEAQTTGKQAGFQVEILDKKQIESLKMGGLLAINRGSYNHPAFITLTYKPQNHLNTKPIILVGKGIVYDTGGLSLKPTSNSMDYMKCDMAGAAAVIAVLHITAKLKLPYNIVGLIPATDNALSNNSIVPGDIIYMHNGKSVEILNTDAEGRLILADALSYAQKYVPELVIDLATLTGSASRAIGQHGIVAMGKVNDEIMELLKLAGNNCYERIVEFPLWDEYEKMIKSDIADLKNIGGENAGAITAGKFLEQFTNYPWIHLDIATNAFLSANDDYRGKGGTGTGVRLLIEFFNNYFAKSRAN